MGTVVQFVGTRRVEVVETAHEALPPASLRVRTLYSGISGRHRADRLPRHEPLPDQDLGPERRRLFVAWRRRAALPGGRLGLLRGRRGDRGVRRRRGAARQPAVGDVVWGIWGHRSEADRTGATLDGHTVPAGAGPARRHVRQGRRGRATTPCWPPDIHLGETVAVFGQGVIGLLATRLATLSGARVVAVRHDRRPGWRWRPSSARWPRSTSGETSPAELTRSLTGGRGADVAIGAVGHLRGAARGDPVGRGRRPGGRRGLLPGRRGRTAARRGVPPQPGGAGLLADRRVRRRGSPDAGTRTG